MTKDRAELEKRLGYHFKDKGLLTLALTHASTRGEGEVGSDNERLEFLGDRVLGLVVAESLLEKFPGESEGELARRFNRLVKKDTCAEVAVEMDLGPHLILSESEQATGGRKKRSILANACEAVLGAAFLDGGYQAAACLVRRFWEGRMSGATTAHLDPKSALQEWAQSQGLSLPRYAEISREGPDHAPRFTAEVRVAGLTPAQGSGGSKRASESAAARALLIREGVWEKGPDE